MNESWSVLLLGEGAAGILTALNWLSTAPPDGVECELQDICVWLSVHFCMDQQGGILLPKVTWQFRSCRIKLYMKDFFCCTLKILVCFFLLEEICYFFLKHSTFVLSYICLIGSFLFAKQNALVCEWCFENHTEFVCESLGVNKTCFVCLWCFGSNLNPYNHTSPRWLPVSSIGGNLTR